MSIKIPEQCRKLKFGTMPDTGETIIVYNSLTEALGYNKFLSLSHSRFGKCVSACCKPVRMSYRFKKGRAISAYALPLKKVVEVILPNFMDGFFRELNGQPSRRRWHGTDPREIYHNAEVVLRFLTEHLGMYELNPT